MDIAGVVELQHYQTLEDVIKLASRVERHQCRQAQKSFYHHKSDDGEKEEKRETGRVKERQSLVMLLTKHNKRRAEI